MKRPPEPLRVEALADGSAADGPVARDSRDAAAGRDDARDAAAGRDEMGLLGGLLSRFTDLVGDGPGYATFHFASQQEGQRLGAGAQPGDLPEVLRRVDSILGHRSRLVAATAQEVRLSVAGSRLLAMPGRTGSGVVLGFIEGVLRAVYNRPYEGALDWAGAEGDGRREAVLVFHGASA